jgi:hypothetical protein
VDAARPEVLPADASQGLLFTLAISESADEREAREELEIMRGEKPRRATKQELDSPAPLASSFTTWQIDYVKLDVRGVTKE